MGGKRSRFDNPLRICVSYYKVYSWAYGPQIFKLQVMPDENSRQEFVFTSHREGVGQQAAQTISTFVEMIMADKKDDDFNAAYAAKEKEWRAALKLASPARTPGSPFSPSSS